MLPLFIPPAFIDVATIALYVIIGLLAILIIYFILDKVVFVGRKNKKLHGDLHRKYEYVHSLLIGQDSAFIKRLEILSDVNLLMRPMFEDVYVRFEALRDNNDRAAQTALRKIQEALNQKNNKVFREVYNAQRPIVIAFERDVIALDRELADFVRPEEDARQASLTEKEQLRQITATYRLHQGELFLVTQSFDNVFANVERTFAQYDNAVEMGEYEEAHQILAKISKVLQSLSTVLETLPDLCLQATTTIPQKVEDLQRIYEQMIKQSYPLHHLMVKNTVDAINGKLVIIIEKLKLFQIKGVDHELDEINQQLDKLFASFDEEKEQRTIYESEFESAYSKVTELERKYIRLANTMPTIRTIFMIPDQRLHEIATIKTNVDQVSSIKRQLETFIHSATRQPYSTLVEKMHNLQEESTIVHQNLEAFQAYLDSLKTDSEEAFLIINSLFHKLKAAEKIVRDLAIPTFLQSVKVDFDRSYSLIETINTTLHVKPIDVATTNDYVLELHSVAEQLLNRVESSANTALLAENAIVLANNYRSNFTDIEMALTQNELRFQQGEFAEVYVEVGNVLRKYAQS